MAQALSIAQDPTEAEQQKSAIKMWMNRIACSKRKFREDFKRMRTCMRFATGLQWDQQKDLNDDRYVVNATLSMVNQKVATLYAKNPVATATARPRLYYQIWDGSVDTLVQSIMMAQQMVATGEEMPLEMGALFADWQHGTQEKKLVDRFCKTFELLYAYQIDSAKPEYKEQVKQAVRRVVINGVAFGRPIYCRDSSEYQKPFSTDTRSSDSDRIGRIRAIIQEIDDGDVEDTSAHYQTLRSLMASLGVSQATMTEVDQAERLEFDFPPSTSIIVDERCRNLVDFVAARWVAQEFILPVEEVNSIFGVKVETGSGEGKAKEYDEQGAENISNSSENSDKDVDPFAKKLVALYEVLDYTTKSRFYIVDGWHEYVLAPEDPAARLANLSGFWPIFALVFNNVEVEPGSEASIYPPSDVQNVIHAQREMNRSREALRDHRNANAPRYVTREGVVSEEDIRKIVNAQPNEVLQLKTVPADMKLSDVLAPVPTIPITPELYDVTPLEEDMLRATGTQQANIGPAQPNVTATNASIAEQSRMSVSASNIDDLDGWLSRMAQAGGELLLQEMPVELVQEIVGMGAVWPTTPQTRQRFLKQVYMSIQAASSGRPNKAVEIQNFTQIAPLLQAAGASPIGLVETGVEVLDSNLDVSKFFPLTPPAQSGPSTGQETSRAQGSGKPPKEAGPPEPPSAQRSTPGPADIQPAPLAATPF